MQHGTTKNDSKFEKLKSNTIAHLIENINTKLSLLRYQQYFSDVEKYVMFVGYARSGHTLLASCLNSHEEVVIAHELNALKYICSGIERKNLFSMLICQDKWFDKKMKQTWEGYNYRIPNQHQGQFVRLRIIGDKKAAGSAKLLSENPGIIENLRETVLVPLRIFHYIRNPFDNISTMAIRADIPIELALERYFRRAETIRNLKDSLLNNEYLEVHHDTLIKKPRVTLQECFNFIGAESNTNIIEACCNVFFTNPSRSRAKIRWSKSTIHDVEERIQEFTFLQGYTFEND